MVVASTHSALHSPGCSTSSTQHRWPRAQPALPGKGTLPGGRKLLHKRLFGPVQPVQPRTTCRLQVTASSAPQPQVSLLQPVPVDASASKPLLVYFSGTDGTGNAIAPQLPGLIAAGFDVRCLYIAMTNRSSWEQLLAEVLPLLRTLVADRPANQRRVTLVGESFGGCLALRLAIAAPQLLERMVLVNPATCFAKSYGGLSSFIAGTNLLSLFPETLYQAAQAVMIPLLLDPEKVGRNTVGAIKSMMIMTPPPNFKAGQGFVAADEGRRQLGGPQGLQLYLPAATASWRLRLLREGDVPDHQLATIRTPTLILASAEDRLLPSRAESARLQRVIPDARRLLLPSSGHTALLEEAVNLADIMKRTGFLPEDQPAPAPVSQGSAELLRSGAAYAYPSMTSAASMASTVGAAAAPQASPGLDVPLTSRTGLVPAIAATGSASASVLAAGDTLERPGSTFSRNGSSSDVGSRIGTPGVALTGQPITRQPDVGNRTNGSGQGNGIQPPYSGGASANGANGAARRPAAVIMANGQASPPSNTSSSSGGSNGAPSGNGSSQGNLPSLADWADKEAPEFVAQLNEAQNKGSASWPAQAAANASTATAARNAAVIAPSPLESQVLDREAAARFASSNGASPPGNLAAAAATMATNSAAASTSTTHATPASSSQAASASGNGHGSVPSTANGKGSVHVVGSSARRRQRAERAANADSREPESYLGSWDAIDEAYEAGAGTLELFRNIISPAMSGVEHLPDPLSTKRPILFVGNHTLYGVYDLPFLMYELYIRGFKARGLAHPSHWQGPVGEFFERYGAVKASPMAAYRLLKEKQAVLLFPGGGREVNKRKGEAYQLQWRDSPDFVRLAAKLKAIIVPFAALGADDAFDLALDTDEILGSPLLGPLARALLARVDPALDPAETVFPISKLPYTGLPSLVPIPKPERLYFRFLPAIDTTQALQNVGDAEQCMRVYGGVKARVLAGIAELKAEREADPERHLPRRLLAQAKRMMPAFDLMKDVIH